MECASVLTFRFRALTLMKCLYNFRFFRHVCGTPPSACDNGGTLSRRHLSGNLEWRSREWNAKMCLHFLLAEKLFLEIDYFLSFTNIVIFFYQTQNIQILITFLNAISINFFFVTTIKYRTYKNLAHNLFFASWTCRMQNIMTNHNTLDVVKANCIILVLSWFIFKFKSYTDPVNKLFCF